ncbi:MAG: 50S ribosomal protein L4 [Candidatus Altiarchaeales archaeon]|nr:MAG: 50S ribosomal protein L4 [Candidatus Altiarchaeales archaeon]HDO82588.1 50S ribosomal protein L4 [Candidatus Altiarchaeales archaeon]HEX55237.1 50S ribosomal protein L4 [Candidatus Altiarchaeales archaeon]
MVRIYSINGKIIGKMELPDVFNTEYRPDLIQRAVVAIQSNRRQRYSAYALAGQQTSADYFGRRRGAFRQTINRGISRLPREKLGGGGLGRVRIVPHAVGGRRAHPPKGRDWSKKINNKEYLLALKSAIAATKDEGIVSARGHIITGIRELPLIIEDKFEELNKTKEVIESLNKLGLEKDLERAREKRIRAGKGKMRGRRYKKKKSVLIVVNNDGGILSSARNIPGVDAVRIDDLDVELLAPGTHAGRLTLWTKSAIENIHRLFT